MAHSLLLGNGINRVAQQRQWTEILQELASHFGAQDLLPQINAKPLSMFIEELCARSSERFNAAERTIKIEFAKLLKQIEPIEAHRQICSPFSVILTTNYDFTIEEAFAGGLYHSAFLAPESRYSLFRRHQAANKDIWHIHGDIARPDSMLLGFDHYAGNLQKIRNYVTDGIDVKRVNYRVSSPVKNGNLDFTANQIYSWVDYFLRDHIHIVGLGMDFTEIDLWWLLLHKRRRLHQPGKVFFYHNTVDSELADTPITSLLKSLNVDVVSVVAASYLDCYLKTAKLIEERMALYPAHHPKPEVKSDASVLLIPPRDLKISRPKQASLRFPKP